MKGEKGVFSLGGEHLDSYGGFDFSSSRFVTLEFYGGMRRGVLRADDILIVKDGATTGKVSYVGNSFPYHPCCINEHVFRLALDKTVADPMYVFYYLFSPEGNREILSDFRGATVGGISQEFVNRVRVPLPPLTGQKRIAAILARADHLRRLRCYARELGDTHLQSVFLEMFGDPASNPMGWEIKELGTQIKSVRYGTGSPPEYQEDGIPFIRATNIKKGTVQRNHLAYISESDARTIAKCKVNQGDLIIVRSGVNTGDCALIPHEFDEAYAAYDLIIQVPYPQNYYYNLIINSDCGRSIIRPLSRRAGQPHINAEQVESLSFPVPPVPLQERFAHIAQRFERLQAQEREAERQAGHLFQTLLHQAFRGELS